MKFTKASIARFTVPAGRSELIVFDEDMPGFGLRLRAGGAAVWIAQYRVGAKQRRVTLGRTATLDPDRARRAAREILAKADLGQDAQAERRNRQAKVAVTFGAVAKSYLMHVAATQKPKTHAERQRHIERDWKPFGSLPVHEIDRRNVAARLRVVADEHGPIASNRARGTLSAFYAWAISHGLADTNPVIGAASVGVERSRSRVLASAEIALIWHVAGDGDYARILKLLLLTGQRRGEVAGIKDAELDLGSGLWVLPAERTKNGLPHEVPLSRQSMALLAATPRNKERALLFGKANGPFSGWSKPRERINSRIAQHRAERRLGRPLETNERPKPDDALAPWTLHDLRRTVVTGMNELGIAPHVVEAVVNHVSGRAKAGVAGVYNRAAYGNEKRIALQAWADHLDQLLGQDARQLIPLRA